MTIHAGTANTGNTVFHRWPLYGIGGNRDARTRSAQKETSLLASRFPPKQYPWSTAETVLSVFRLTRPDRCFPIEPYETT